MRTTTTALLLSAAVLVMGTTKAEAASITFATPPNNTFTAASGWGNVMQVLGLQEDDIETGGVAWNGTADVYTTDDVTNQSTTRTVTELTTYGIAPGDSQFGVVFNINQTGSDESVDLTALRVDFFLANGDLLFSTDPLAGTPLTLTEDGQGGGSSGFLFIVSLSPTEWGQFYEDPDNRLGMFATVLNGNNGPEGFYLVPMQGDLPLDPSVVPEPASLLLLGSGLFGLVAYRRIRQRRHP